MNQEIVDVLLESMQMASSDFAGYVWHWLQQQSVPEQDDQRTRLLDSATEGHLRSLMADTVAERSPQVADVEFVQEWLDGVA